MSEELGRSPSMEAEVDPEPESRTEPTPDQGSGQDLVPQQPAHMSASSFAKEVIYEIRDKAEYTETRAVFIGNLTTPFDNADFQRMLNDEAAKTGATIERAWLNNKRSHCIVIVSSVEGAVEIRRNLNGRFFPEELSDAPESTESGASRQQLYVDFIPVKATQLWIDQENHSPKDAVWKVSYTTKIGRTSEKPFLAATHQMVNYPNHGLGYKSTGTSYYSGRRGPRRGYSSRDRDFRDSRDGGYRRGDRGDRENNYYGRRGGAYRDSRDPRDPRDSRDRGYQRFDKQQSYRGREASRSPARYSRSRSPGRSRSPRWTN